MLMLFAPPNVTSGPSEASGKNF